MKERTVGPGRGPGGRTGLKRHDGNRPIQRRGDQRQGGPGSAQGKPGLVAHQRPRISARGISALGSSPDASSPKASTTATVDDPSRPGSWTGRQGASIRTRICAYMRAGRTRICAQGLDRGTPRPWTGASYGSPRGDQGRERGSCSSRPPEEEVFHRAQVAVTRAAALPALEAAQLLAKPWPGSGGARRG